MENALINIVTIFLGLAVGSKLSADQFLVADTLAILEEAHSVIEGQTKVTIPEVPDSLKHDIVQRRSADVLI